MFKIWCVDMLWVHKQLNEASTIHIKTKKKFVPSMRMRNSAWLKGGVYINSTTSPSKYEFYGKSRFSLQRRDMLCDRRWRKMYQLFNSSHVQQEDEVSGTKETQPPT